MVYNEYIALSKPYEASELCEQYGIQVNPENPEEISLGLSEIVANNGEDGLKDVMKLHPDRSVIIELASKAKKYHNFIGSDEEVPCQHCNRGRYYMHSYAQSPVAMSASGEATASTTNAINTQTGVMMQQNTFLVLGIIVVAAILISRK